MSLCSEIRTVDGCCWWRRWEVRVLRQPELFFPEREATSEDIDPGHRRRSCTLIVEDFQDMELRTMQRWGAVGLAHCEEFCEVGWDSEARMPTQDPFLMNIQIAAATGRMSTMWMSLSPLADHV